MFDAKSDGGSETGDRTVEDLSRRTVLRAGGAATAATVGLGHTTRPTTAATATATGPTVYVGANEGDDDGALYAVDAATGSRRWVFDEPATPVQSGPTVVDGVVYFTDEANTVYAVDAETGTEEWTLTELGGYNTHSPTVVGERVHVTSENGVYAIDASTGEIKWEAATGEGFDYATPVVDGRVYANGSRLYAFDAETGEELWTFERDTVGTAGASPTVADGTVYLPGSETTNTLYAVDAETGTEEWRFETDGAPDAVSPTVHNGTVYVGTIKEVAELEFEGRVHAIDIETQTEQWRYESTRTNIGSAPTVANGQVFFGASGLIAVGAETGDQQWRVGDPAIVRSAPTVADGIAFVGADDASLYAIETATGETVWKFDEPSSYVVSSPTIVQDPKDGHSAGSRVRLRTLGHHDKSPDPMNIEIPDDPLEKYRDDGEVTDTGLLEAISDWRNGSLGDTDLLSLISEWREAGGEMSRIASQLTFN